MVMPFLMLFIIALASCRMSLDTSTGDSSLESHAGRINVLESTAMSSKGVGIDVVIDVIEYEDAFYEETRPYNVFFQNSHEKSTSCLKRAKVLFLKRVFNTSFEKVL